MNQSSVNAELRSEVDREAGIPRGPSAGTVSLRGNVYLVLAASADLNHREAGVFSKMHAFVQSRSALILSQFSPSVME